MVEAATPIAANSSVDIPADTRTSSVAPADQWPDACALLAPEDVRAIFSDMKIDPPRKTMRQIKHESRIDRVEDLPKAMRCLYQTSRADLVNGARRFVTYSVNLNVSNMAATPELLEEILRGRAEGRRREDRSRRARRRSQLERDERHLHPQGTSHGRGSRWRRGPRPRPATTTPHGASMNSPSWWRQSCPDFELVARELPGRVGAKVPDSWVSH